MPETKPTEFILKVMAVLRKIPRGRVATYQQVAALAGKEHASRAVAWILNSSAEKYKLPWQRVIGSSGKISFKPGTKGFLRQRQLLSREGVTVARNGEIDLDLFQWSKKVSRRRPRRGVPTMFG